MGGRWWRDSALHAYLEPTWASCFRDDIFFLASGIAFNILLATVPFGLLLVSGLTYVVNLSAAASLARMGDVIDRILPPESAGGAAAPLIHTLLGDVSHAGGRVGLYSAICFIWFTTRLFGSLRGVLSTVFRTETDRGLVEGKLFDAQITIGATLLVLVYAFLSAYLAMATTRGVHFLAEIGVQRAAMGRLAYTIGQIVTFAVAGALLFALYRVLPKRWMPIRTALVAATVGAIAFEIVQGCFALYLRHFNPASLYTGTLAAIVIVLVWVYCVAAIFVVGAEVGHIYQLRHAGGRRHAGLA